jgi:hypothetical protein
MRASERDTGSVQQPLSTGEWFVKTFKHFTKRSITTMRKTLSFIVALVLAACGCAAGFAQSATTPFSSSVYQAANFGTWSIQLDSPNTYIFAGRTRCNSMANNIPFFDFSTSGPVWIQDSNTANSEVVTPSAITQTAGSCGVTVSPANNHYTAWLRSGTGGLQEALNAIGGSSATVYPAEVWLDRNWYAQASNVPSTTPQAIILAATGNAGTFLVDITTAPNTYYLWDGAHYVASGAQPAFPNNRVTSYTKIAAPTALTTVAATCLANAGGCITSTTTGGTIPANSAAYTLGATCVDATGGETTLSVDTAAGATVTPTGTASTSTISVSSPAGCTAANGAVGWRLYMTANGGASLSEILYTPTCTSTALQTVLKSVCAIGSTATISAVVTGTATVPATTSAFPRTTGTSNSFPPFTALGTIATTATGTLGAVNLPAGYLNTLGRSLMFCGNGYATTNGTAGTVTLKMTVASIPGVTLITPFSVISPSIAASAIQLPINFCVTITTAATGATGTLEVHGWVDYGVAGTVVSSPAQDIIFTVSSTVDLTKQDQIAFTITPTTAGLTAAQLRQLTVYPSN